METTGMTNATGWQNEEQTKSESSHQAGEDQEQVPLESLSELTGFPVEFIKKELLLDGENVSMSDLRQSIVRYLETTSEEFQQS